MLSFLLISRFQLAGVVRYDSFEITDRALKILLSFAHSVPTRKFNLVTDNGVLFGLDAFLN